MEINSIDQVRDYIETNYEPVYQKRLKSTGIKLIWDNGNVLLNGMSIRQSDKPALRAVKEAGLP